jgi:VWFA-related protein
MIIDRRIPVRGKLDRRILWTIAFGLGVAALLLPSVAQPAQQAAPSNGPPAIHIDTNALLVPVVVRDGQGNAIGTLTQSDFQVFDQGKPMPISGFTLAKSGAAPIDAPPAAASPAPAATAASGAIAAPPAVQPRFIAFLFDDRHLNAIDLDQTKKAASQILNEPLAVTDRAVVLSFLGVNSGLTRDPAVLQSAIAKLRVNQLYQHNAGECPDIDYYAADQILNKDNHIEYDEAMAKATVCGHGNIGKIQVLQTATRSLQTGDEDARSTMEYIGNIVRTMSQMPGQRTLVLISPGFFSDSTDAMNLKSQVLNLAAGANVTISALDARGLYSTNIQAGENGPLMDLDERTGHRREMMRANMAVMAELSEGTGGTFFHNNNDLKGGLKSLVAAPEYVYLLEVSLKNVKLNGTYHPLQVKVDQDGVKVQARRGFFAPTPPKNKK